MEKVLHNKKIILIISTTVIGLVGITAYLVFDSQQVTAQIIPVTVSTSHLSFGTVFPGEELQGNFIVNYVDEEGGINYRIIQRLKPFPEGHPDYPGYYRDLCPFLTPISVDEDEGDATSSAFVGTDDPSDNWIIYFKVPAIFGHVGQDHTGGVVSENGEYGCDIAIDIDIEDICNPNQNLVINGSFETPLVTHSSLWDIFPSVAGGWTVEWRGDIPATYGGYPRPDPANLEFHRGVLGPANDGSQYVELDTDWNGHVGSLNNEPASVKIYQDIPTIPGMTYNIEYYFSPRPSTAASNNVLQFSWDGNVKATTTVAGGSSTVWSPYNYSFTASGSTTRLQFADLGTADGLGTFLDNVSVRCVLLP